MAFTFVRNMISGMAPITPPKDNMSFEIDETTMVAGQVAKFTAGKLKNATDDNVDAAVILLEGGADGDMVRCMWITPGAVFKTKCLEGTAASVTLGGRYEIDATFLGLNQGGAGPLSVVDIDGTDLFVTFNSCLISQGPQL
jgi:hypothetical protein